MRCSVGWPEGRRWRRIEGSRYALVLAGLDASRLDHPGPLLGFVGYMLSQVGWRERKRRSAQFQQSFLDLGISESGIDLGIELIDDLRRSIFGGAESLPPARFITWQEIAHGRDIRQNVQALCRRHRQGSQRTGFDVLDR